MVKTREEAMARLGEITKSFNDFSTQMKSLKLEVENLCSEFKLDWSNPFNANDHMFEQDFFGDPYGEAMGFDGYDFTEADKGNPEHDSYLDGFNSRWYSSWD